MDTFDCAYFCEAASNNAHTLCMPSGTLYPSGKSLFRKIGLCPSSPLFGTQYMREQFFSKFRGEKGYQYVPSMTPMQTQLSYLKNEIFVPL